MADPKSDLVPPDAARAYRFYLPEAQALAADAVVLPYRLDADLAIINIGTGMSVVHTFKERIPVELPKVNLQQLVDLPGLALAHKFAVLLAEQAAPSEKLVSERLAEARELRSILMPAVQALAAVGLVSLKSYEAIASGRGPRDTAADCVSLGRLIVDGGDRLAGKHPVSTEQVQRAIEVGSWLWQVLKTDKAPKNTTPQPLLPEVDIRNRMATLLIQRHEKLQLVAFNFYGASYELYVPALNSRRAQAKKPDNDTGDETKDETAAKAKKKAKKKPAKRAGSQARARGGFHRGPEAGEADEEAGEAAGEAVELEEDVRTAGVQAAEPAVDEEPAGKQAAEATGKVAVSASKAAKPASKATEPASKATKPASKARKPTGKQSKTSRK